jgi:hypothetical protein
MLCVIAIGITLAFPWYLMMVVKYDMYLSGWSGLISALGSGTYHTSVGSWWYYINQLIISYPFIFLVFVPITKIVGKVKKHIVLQINEKLFLCSLIWLMLMLGIISLIKTNMPHFVLFISIPVTICSIFALEVSLKEPNKLLVKLSFALSSIAILWGMSEQLRMYVKGKTVVFEYDIILLFVLCLCIITAIYYVMKQAGNRDKTVTLLITALVISNVYRWSIKSENTFIDGASDVVSQLKKNMIDDYLVIHKDGLHDSLIPQFSYYAADIRNQDRAIKVKSRNEVMSSITKTFSHKYQAVLLYSNTDRYYQNTKEETKELLTLDSVLHAQYTYRLSYHKYTLYYALR